MSALYQQDRLRQIEASARERGEALMERAGQAAAEVILRWRPEVNRVHVLAGPGNNGGDGLVCARLLQQAGLQVGTWFLSPPAYRGEAAEAWQRWQATGGQTLAEPALADCDLVVDALFGIGLARPLAAPLAPLIDAINQCGKPVLALDVPSGLDAFTGHAAGPAVQASHTLTFLGDKPGLHTGPGRDLAGTVTVDWLGLSPRQRPAADGDYLETRPACLQALRRRHDVHKGHFGSVAIFGGAPGMLGAPLLAGRAALKLGAGKVRVGFLATDFPPVDLLQPELMLHPAAELAEHTDRSLLVVGPGLGQSTGALSLLQQQLATPLPLLLDADALNLIAATPALQQQLTARAAPSVLTPHPAEAARLLGTSNAAVQADRLAAAQTLSTRFQATVLLKGAGSVICHGERWAINGSGNAALSNAGQGDALAGLLAALWAQGLPPFEASCAAAWLHGQAADQWRLSHPLGIGLTASEVIDLAREAFNQP